MEELRNICMFLGNNPPENLTCSAIRIKMAEQADQMHVQELL